MANQRISPDPDVVAERIQDEMVLVQLRTNRIYALNPTAARAWELLAEGNDRQTVEKRVQSEFDAAPEDVARELDGLLRSLAEEGLVSSGDA